MLLMVLFSIIGLIAFAMILNKRQVIKIDLSPARTVTGPALLVPLPDDQPPDVLVLTSETGSTNQTLAYLNHEKRDIRWSSPSLGDADQPITITRWDQVLYVVGAAPRLIALNQEDGNTLWQADLTAEMTATCQDCLATNGTLVFILTSDGFLQALAAESGEIRWSYQLNTIPDRLLLIGDRPAIIDDLEASTDKALYIFDPLTGLPAQVIQPTCQFDEGTENLGPNSAAIVHEQAIYFLFGASIQGCAQRWDAKSGSMTWRRSFDLERSSWPRSWYNTASLLAGETIYFAGEENGVLLALNTESGDLDTVARSETHNLQPLAVNDGVLIAHAVRIEGANQDQLWALDVASGAVQWMYPFWPESTSWAAHPGPTGLVVIQVLSGPDRVLVDILDQHSGERLHQKITAVNSTYWSGITWQPDTAWLTLRDLYTVDLTTGETMLYWPLPENSN
jgi:outer membrane protein assembly factor BamB